MINNEADKKIIRSNGRSYRLKVEQNKKAFFYPDEWQRFYSMLKEKQRIYFDILINTGCRINESRFITPADVDNERNVLHIRMTKVRAKEGEKKPTGRRIPISTEFKNILLRYAKNNNIKQNDNFPMLSTAQIGSILKVNCNLINKKEWSDMSAHNVRKTFESWLFALGIDSFKIANHLGHTLIVAQKNYVGADLFKQTDRIIIRRILGDLYLS